MPYSARRWRWLTIGAYVLVVVALVVGAWVYDRNATRARGELCVQSNLIRRAIVDLIEQATQPLPIPKGLDPALVGIIEESQLRSVRLREFISLRLEPLDCDDIGRTPAPATKETK